MPLCKIICIKKHIFSFFFFFFFLFAHNGRPPYVSPGHPQRPRFTVGFTNEKKNKIVYYIMRSREKKLKKIPVQQVAGCLPRKYNILS
jgi:hypothetical protein